MNVSYSGLFRLPIEVETVDKVNKTATLLSNAQLPSTSTKGRGRGRGFAAGIKEPRMIGSLTTVKFQVIWRRTAGRIISQNRLNS